MKRLISHKVTLHRASRAPSAITACGRQADKLWIAGEMSVQAWAKVSCRDCRKRKRKV